MTTDKIKVGKKIMVRCEVVEEYQGDCHVMVELPDGTRKRFHLNSFLPPTLESHEGWEY